MAEASDLTLPELLEAVRQHDARLPRYLPDDRAFIAAGKGSARPGTIRITIRIAHGDEQIVLDIIRGLRALGIDVEDIEAPAEWQEPGNG